MFKIFALLNQLTLCKHLRFWSYSCKIKERFSYAALKFALISSKWGSGNAKNSKFSHSWSSILEKLEEVGGVGVGEWGRRYGKKGKCFISTIKCIIYNGKTCLQVEPLPLLFFFKSFVLREASNCTSTENNNWCYYPQRGSMQYTVSRYLPIIIIPRSLEATDWKKTTAEFSRQQQRTVKEISLRLAHSLYFCSAKIGVFLTWLHCKECWEIIMRFTCIDSLFAHISPNGSEKWVLFSLLVKNKLFNPDEWRVW